MRFKSAVTTNALCCNMATIHLSRADAKSGNLPRLCLCCGQPTDRCQEKVLRWVPPWVYFLFASPVFGLLVMAFALRRAILLGPLCEQHRNHWHWRAHTFGWNLFAVLVLQGLLCLPWIFWSNRWEMRGILFLVCVAQIALGVGWLMLFLAIWLTSVRASKITKHNVTITNVSFRFAEAFEHFISAKGWFGDSDQAIQERETNDLRCAFRGRPARPPSG